MFIMKTTGTDTDRVGTTGKGVILRIVFFVAVFFSASFLFAEGSMMGGKTEPLMGADMSSRGYARIDADDLMAEMDMKDFQLINVHIPYGGDIPGTDADIAYNRVEDITAMYPDKEQTLVLSVLPQRIDECRSQC